VTRLGTSARLEAPYATGPPALSCVVQFPVFSTVGFCGVSLIEKARDASGSVAAGPPRILTFSILGLGGFVLVLSITSRLGVGLTQDSASYVAAARGLSAGQGLLNYDGKPLVHWPPLFPALLALGAWLRWDPIVTARYLNAAAFGLLIPSAALLFHLYARRWSLVFVGTVLTLLSSSLLGVSRAAWSEPVFILLTTWCLVLLRRAFLDPGRPLALAGAFALAALCSLQRYMGIAVVATCGLSVFGSLRRRPAQRAVWAVAGTLAAGIPLLLWFARNAFLSGTLIGGLGPERASLARILEGVLDILSGWFLPHQIPVPVRVAVPAVLIVVAAFLAETSGFRPRNVYGGESALGRAWPSRLGDPVPAFLVSYVVLYVACLMVVESNRIEDRLLAPLVVPLLCAVIGILDHAAGSGGTGAGRFKRAAGGLWLCLAAGMTVYPAARAVSNLPSWVREGVRYDAGRWRCSETLRRLRTIAREEPGPIFSNEPAAVYVLDDLRAFWAPGQLMDPREFRRRVLQSDRSYLVLFQDAPLVNLDESAGSRQGLVTELVSRCQDGMIYRTR
jgi:hypothetical protein